MKILCLNTPNGLVPVGDDAYELKRKLKIGQVYEADVKMVRNYPFLQKYHSLIAAAWALLPEHRTQGFQTKEIFRKWCEMQAGHCDIIELPDGDVMRMPKSIAFDKMGEDEFSELYERVKDVIWGLVGNYISEAQFESILSHF